jgi:hypothetical protein
MMKSSNWKRDPSLQLSLLTACLAAVAACSSERDDGGAEDGIYGDGDSGGDGDGDGDGNGDGDGDGDGNGDGDGDGDGGVLLDVAAGDGDGDGDSGDDGCDKVDFLFVIDNSGSMADEQNQLIASFPNFIATIKNTLEEAQDYHIMAVSTDNGENTGLNSSCINGDCTCTPAPTCCENACGFGGQTCNGFPCDELPIGPCDFEYGTGKKWDAEGNFCDIDGDKRFMSDGQPDVDSTFTCAAHVGTYGSGDERPMLAMQEAVSEEKNGANGCNEGFLRDDAILVVTIITDEEDDNTGDQNGSPGLPSQWYDAVVAAKNGTPSSVVVLSLVGDSGLPNGVCEPGADPNADDQGAEFAPRIIEFTEMFDNGVIGSVCADNYNDFFLDAVAVIDTTCDEFEPPR